MKKDNVLNWDGYFMALAKVSAMRSKDPSTKVGACIINNEKRVVALGYNGMPKGLDDEFPWNREGISPKETKYPYVVHAEMNAILNAYQKFENCLIYTTLFPCSSCAKTLAQSGIIEVIYEQDKYHNTEDGWIARKILKIAGIKTRKIDVDTSVLVNVGDNNYKG
ncbi:cytidine deaminase [Mycoplasmopsis anatis]|uniref:Deoxycytidylate deaminase protein n=1 Tax=Mycoplasmopsis anatis 1340 TaxID=1034808 RepID=F9QE43_9BACT|nr:cytidine/deoxycytidylate deaminase family protein [Mycoplasmopsis anatis]AWX70360.1 cytidine deaminase [Mycoplasmopsis anatis]EGS28987.1 deoxycytidylate deaminase protein [Mycoplasmopsis anatis 1340]VEU73992.1 Deoxycytidylate deaminase [Mycoplasmopsis anatis]